MTSLTALADTPADTREIDSETADIRWANGLPIRVVSDNIDRTIRNPRPDPSSAPDEHRMTHGKEMFPTLRFFAA